MAHLKLFEAKMKAQDISYTPALVDVCQKIQQPAAFLRPMEDLSRRRKHMKKNTFYWKQQQRYTVYTSVVFVSTQKYVLWFH